MMGFEITRDGGQARVTLGAKLTAAEVTELQPVLKQEIVAGVREIVFDLAETTALDSTGIGLLIAANNSLAPVQGAIRLINLTPDLVKLLQSMRLVDRLHATAAGQEVSCG
jgi:anti-sigma B factor antagonist